MRKIEESFLRLCLKPCVECDIPGRLRLRFRQYELLPKAAIPYLHYVQDVLEMLSGVTDVVINPRIGTVLVRYDAEITTARQILRWVDIVVDTGIELANEADWQGVSEAELERIVRKRLILHLPQKKEG